MKKILVTGGSGYVGSLTVQSLRDKGYYVYNYDIKENPNDDILNTERLFSKMDGMDIVYHLVAIPHPFKGKECDYRFMNYDVAKSAFQTAIRASVSKFIFASSGCYYGVWGGYAKPTQFPIEETTYSPTIAEGQTIYGYLKKEFEQYLEKESEKSKIRSVALRLEGLNINVVKEEGYRNRIFPSSPNNEQSCKLFHFFGNCSPDNYSHLLELVIEKDLDSYFEAFNVDNGTLHPSINPHKVIETYWPHLPDNIPSSNGSLISIEKARKLLDYKPVPPKAYKEWEVEKVLKNNPHIMNSNLIKIQPNNFSLVVGEVTDYLTNNNINDVAIYGAGKNGKLLLSALKLIGVTVNYIFDDYITGELLDYPITKIKTVNYKGDIFIALAKENINIKEITDQIEKLNCKVHFFG